MGVLGVRELLEATNTGAPLRKVEENISLFMSKTDKWKE